tara:strand:- start:10982 stop:11254 length:273 start_codon:yes stop_codon:yes gene_type:complete
MAIKKYSKKMSKTNASYAKLRRKYLMDHPVCHAKIHQCSLHATDVHHKQGRGLHHLDVSTWLPVCRNCHMWIEEHPSEAIELGYSTSRSK